MFSFYRDGHKECCSIRKVEPLKRALSGLNAWITGQRRDQSPGTRTEVPVVQADPYLLPTAGSSSSSIRWLAGVPSRSGTISARMTFPTMPCMTAASSPSGANPAPGQFFPASTSARAAGGGKIKQERVRPAQISFLQPRWGSPLHPEFFAGICRGSSRARGIRKLPRLARRFFVKVVELPEGSQPDTFEEAELRRFLA